MLLPRLVAALILACAPASAENTITPEMDRHLIAGLDAIYRMDFDAAEAASRKVIELNADHPYGHFGLASAAWTRYVYETEQTDQSRIPSVEADMEQVIARCRSWLKAHPQDAHAIMVEGAAYGLMSRLLVMRHEWLKAYWYGRKAVTITRRALKVDPELHDAHLGIGMYDYYTDVYPRVVGVLAKIAFRGNRLRGIKALQHVADKGHYSKNAAKLLLVEIYNTDAFGAKDPQAAAKIMAELRPLYPDSAMLHAAELVCWYEAQRYADVMAGAKEYLRRVQEGKYRSLERAKGSVILATALWALGQRDEALSSFRAGADVKLGAALSRWSVWALIRAAQLQDALGNRDKALADYRLAAAQPDYWGLRAIAKNGLSKPFKEESGPGPIQLPD